MSRGPAILILLVVLVAGALFLLSSRAQETPTRTIEVDVAASSNAG